MDNIVDSFILAVLFVLSLKSINYCSKQILSQNIKEFKTTWQPNSQVSSFDKTYRDGDFRLARLELGSSWKHVKNIYGRPFKKNLETTESPNNTNYIVYFTTWIYPDFEVCFLNSVEKKQPQPKELGDVFAITVTSAKFQSYRGIRVGDPISKVIKRYGRASDYIMDEKSSKFYEWQLNYVKFGVANGKVSEIEVSQNPD